LVTLQDVLKQKDALIEALRQKISTGDVAISYKNTVPEVEDRVEKSKPMLHRRIASEDKSKEGVRKASKALLKFLRQKYLGKP